MENLPRHSALVRVMFPEHWDWDAKSDMLAAAVDSLAWLQWAKTEDAENGNNQPEPWPRPGDLREPQEPEGFELDDMYAMLAERNGERAQVGIT